jgi:hypothetical protein
MELQKKEEWTCNGCGKSWPVINGVCREDFVTIRKKWGYFSNKDTEIHELRLCEACYDKLVRQLVVPPDIRRDVELTYTE